MISAMQLFGYFVQLPTVQWGNVKNGVFTFPIAFNTVFSYASAKTNDHGGGIPNVLSITKTAMTIEFEWLTWENGVSTQRTALASAIHVIAIGI